MNLSSQLSLAMAVYNVKRTLGWFSFLLSTSHLEDEEEEKKKDKETHRERHSEECGGQERVYL